MNQDSSLLYTSNRSLIEALHPSLAAITPVECTGISSLPESEDQLMEPVDLDDIPGFTSLNPRYVIMLGMRDGQWLLDFYNRYNDSIHYLYIIEPNIDYFCNQMGRRPWMALLKDIRVRWYIGSMTSDVQKALLNDVTEIGAWGIHAWKDSLLAEQEPEWFAEMSNDMRFALHCARENVQVQIERGVIIQSNIIKNIPSMTRSMPLESFHDLFPDNPAVVVGAGPSLTGNIAALKKAAPGVVIIASDTALKPLLRQGIQPHFVVACDPLKINHKHFAGIDSLGSSILAYLPDVNADIIEQYTAHPRLLCLYDLQIKLLQRLARPLNIKQAFPRRMNVGFCAFMLAKFMGCSPIIMAGMDLAVSPGNLSHAEGTANASMVTPSEDGKQVRLQGNIESANTPMTQVAGYYGEPVLTFSYFHHTIITLENQIAKINNLVIDATEGGAQKRGAVQMPLSEALSKYTAAEPVLNRLHDIGPANQVGSIKTIILILSNLSQDLKKNQEQLKIGMARLAQWKNEKLPESSGFTPESAAMFLSRWKEILSGSALDVGVDIGLARRRYSTWRMEPPSDLGDEELRDWWYDSLHELFDGAVSDLDMFIGLYDLIIKNLQTRLTSRGE